MLKLLPDLPKEVFSWGGHRFLKPTLLESWFLDGQFKERVVSFLNFYKELVIFLLVLFVLTFLPWPKEKVPTKFGVLLASQGPAQENPGNQIGQAVIYQELPLTIQTPTAGFLSQNFSHYHPAVDIDAEWGDPVKPIAQGLVIEEGWDYHGKGKYVLLEHEDGIRSLYAHLSKIEVKKGDKVGKDSEIGKVGSTGWASGDHLHLEVYDQGRLVNPRNFLP